MQITRTSLLSGTTRTLDLPITDEQLDAWRSGRSAQSVFPHLTADQREFLMTGITAEEWDEAFGDEEDAQ